MRKKTTHKKIKIRKARADDIKSVLIIDAESSGTPLKKKLIETELSNRFSHFHIAHFYESKEPIGYIIYWIVDDILEIHHIAVKNDFQRQGIGSELLDFLLTDARKKKVKKIFLEVRKSNSRAIQFYDKFGFKKAGIRKNYYRNPEEDALVYVSHTDEKNPNKFNYSGQI